VAIYSSKAGLFDRIEGSETLSKLPGSPRFYPVRSTGGSIPSAIDQRGVPGFVRATGETAEPSLYNAVSAAGKLTGRMR
jgi:L-amino acid ligase C-terminal domain 2